MATYTKPTRVPEWADTSTNITEPSGAKKDEGWLFQEIPSSAWENDRAHLVGEWFKWIDERWGEDSVDDDPMSLLPLHIDNDDDFVLHHRGDDPSISFKGKTGNTYILYDSLNDQIECWAGGNEQLRIDTSWVRARETLQIVDANFRMEFAGVDPEIVFDDSDLDRILFDRSANEWIFQVAGIDEVIIGATGMQVVNGLNVGFTGAITDGTVRVGGSTFGFDWNAGAAKLDFNSATYMQLISPNLDFALVSAKRFRMTETDFRPFTNHGASLGASSFYWDNVRAHAFIANEDILAPADQFNLAKRSVRNNISAAGSFILDNVGYGILATNHFNILQITRVGVGDFRITLDQAVDTSQIFGVNYDPSTNTAINAYAELLSSTQVWVQTFNSAGANVDPNNAVFSFILSSGPQTLPT